MAEKTFQLHAVVSELASRLELAEGRMIMSDTELVRSRALLIKVQKPEDKKAVLVSLVALASRLARENREAASQVIERLLELAGELIGDSDQAQKIFAEAGATHGLARAKSTSKKKR